MGDFQMDGLDIFLGPILIDPLKVGWNAAILAVFSVVAVAGGVIARGGWKSPNIRLDTWTTVCILRIIQAVLGFATPSIARAAANHEQALTETSRALTFVWDLGSYFILCGLFRGLVVSLVNHKKLANRFYNWWALTVWVQILLGYILSGVAGNLTEGMMGLVSLRLMRTARTLLQVSLAFEALSIAILFVGFANVVYRRRPGGLAPRVPAFATGLAAFPVLIVMVVRNVSDQFRQWKLHDPPLGELLGAGLLPEAVAFAVWLALLLRVRMWERSQVKQGLGVEEGTENGEHWQPPVQPHVQPHMQPLMHQA